MFLKCIMFIYEESDFLNSLINWLPEIFHNNKFVFRTSLSVERVDCSSLSAAAPSVPECVTKDTTASKSLFSVQLCKDLSHSCHHTLRGGTDHAPHNSIAM